MRIRLTYRDGSKRIVEDVYQIRHPETQERPVGAELYRICTSSYEWYRVKNGLGRNWPNMRVVDKDFDEDTSKEAGKESGDVDRGIEGTGLVE